MVGAFLVQSTGSFSFGISTMISSPTTPVLARLEGNSPVLARLVGLDVGMSDGCES